MKALAIISIVLLLLFVFLWYSGRSDLDEATSARDAAVAARETAEKNLSAKEQQLIEVSQAVGFQVGAYTDPKQVQANSDPGNASGLLGKLRALSRFRIPREYWKASPDVQIKAANVDINKFPDLLQKIRALEELRPKEVPVPPDEDATDEEKAKYASDKAEYDRKYAEYEKATTEIASHPEWPAYKREIGAIDVGSALVTPGEIIEVDFFANAPASTVQLEAVVNLPDDIIDRMAKAFVTNKQGDVETILALRKELADKEKVITSPEETALGLREQLQREQAAHTADVTRLQGEIQDLTGKAEGYRVEASNAQNELAKAREEGSRDKRTLQAQIDALNEFRRQTKEHAELEIRRNDPDGQILDANVALGTSYINLGRLDRVYPGLKFDVFGVGRGGIREPKGTILVQRVLDAHYSQATIVRVDESRPMIRGDTVHNPFYSATEEIHVFLAGDLKKYPKAIAAARLARAHVVIDSAIGPETDYVVVPDTLRAPVETAAPADGGDDPAATPAVGTPTAYDRLREQAKTFGATLVTEQQLESFLDY